MWRTGRARGAADRVGPARPGRPRPRGRRRLPRRGSRDAPSRRSAAYGPWALARPHLYRLATQGPLPRERLPEGLEAWAAEPGRTGGRFRGKGQGHLGVRHGIILELDGRFPPVATSTRLGTRASRASCDAPGACAPGAGRARLGAVGSRWVARAALPRREPSWTNTERRSCVTCRGDGTRRRGVDRGRHRQRHRLAPGGNSVPPACDAERTRSGTDGRRCIPTR